MKLEFKAGLITGCVITIITCYFAVRETDMYAIRLQKLLDNGNKLRAAHNGLLSVDDMGHYTCNNGTVITRATVKQ